jgi:hypothetical protein
MEPKPMTDQEALDYIKKNYGSYSAYRAQQLNHAPEIDAGRGAGILRGGDGDGEARGVEHRGVFSKTPGRVSPLSPGELDQGRHQAKRLISGVASLVTTWRA